MAPTTRLHQKPELRVNYSATASRGSRTNPIVIRDSPRVATARRSTGTLTRPAGVVRKKASVKKAPPLRRDCSICANSRSETWFPSAKGGFNICAHFGDICKRCIDKLVKTKVTDRKLQEAELTCLNRSCQHVLSFCEIKAIICKEVFETWDDALFMYHLRASESFIACLNPVCGQYFSIEGCGSKKAQGQKKQIPCPYCEYELCIDCNRPWHGDSDCDKNKKAENEKSEEAIKSLGAKPCPMCGVKIEKAGGCDHMNCDRCRHNFCWQCLVAYGPNMQHAPDCMHGLRNIAQDPGNYYNGPMNGVMNALQNGLPIPIPPAQPIPPAIPGLAPAPQDAQAAHAGHANVLQQLPLPNHQNLQIGFNWNMQDEMQHMNPVATAFQGNVAPQPPGAGGDGENPGNEDNRANGEN